MSTITREIGPSGSLGLKKFSRWPQAITLGVILRHGLPRPGLGREVNMWRFRNLDNLWRGAWKVLLAKVFGLQVHYGALYLDKLTPQGRVPLGLASLRVVTTAGANYIVDAFQNIVELENMKYHGYGLGSNAEATADAALQTELTTQYLVDNNRPTGTQTENGANVYETVGMLDPDAAVTITEHGIFSAVTGGVLLDRSVFTGVPLAAAGDQLQATYDFTVTAGS